MLPGPQPDSDAPPRDRDSQACDNRGKVRLRFRKGGDLRLVSHHDLMHCFERMLRRAELPFCSTQGFHPMPRMAFALSLALGIVGCEEVVEVELAEPFDPEEVRQRLTRQCPLGLEFLRVCRVPPKTKAQVCWVSYRLPVPPARLPGLPDKISQLLQSSECWMERTRPKVRRFNLRLFLRDLRLAGEQLEMDLRVTPTGAVRPDEVLKILGLNDLLEQGAILERTKMELMDEIPEQERSKLLVEWAVPTEEKQGKETGPRPESLSPEEEPAATERATTVRPAPLLPGPLSFDT
jgi:radical SAM-linked protein